MSVFTHEYLEQRLQINEEALVRLGELLGAHFPAIRFDLQEIGAAWGQARRQLNAEMLDTPNKT